MTWSDSLQNLLHMVNSPMSSAAESNGNKQGGHMEPNRTDMFAESP